MRFTVLKQMAKSISIPDANPDDPDDHPERLLESAKWFLWHGNVHRSLQRIDTLIELIEPDERVLEGPERRKLARTLNELYEYLESSFPTMGIVVDTAKRFHPPSLNPRSIK
jgi:hypothetical protein